MSASVLEREAPATDVQTPDVDEDRLVQLMKQAGDLGSRSVLVVGAPRLCVLAKEAGAESVALVDAEPAPEGVKGRPGPFPALTFLDRYDVVLVPTSFDGGGDPLPVLARACAVANDRVVAYLPRPRKGWFGKAPSPDAPSHDPDRIKSLLTMCGASATTDSAFKGGFIIRALLPKP